MLDPVGLNQLIPDWKAKGAPVTTPVREDHFLYLGEAGDLRLPNFDWRASRPNLAQFLKLVEKEKAAFAETRPPQD